MLDQEIFKYKKDRVTYGDFVKAYDNLGIKKGDAIFLQTQLLAFGRLMKQKGQSRDEIMNRFISDLQKTVGEGGTLMMTTYSPKGESILFDPQTTPSEGGILTEYFRKGTDVIRSLHPTHSFAIWGDKKDFLNIDESTFGSNSIYGKLLTEDVTLLFWGAGFYYCTFNHVLEEMAKVPYRKKNLKTVNVSKNGNLRNFNLVTYTKSDRYKIDFTRFEKELVDNGIMKVILLGGGSLATVKSKELYELGMEHLKKDPYYFLKVEPFGKYWIRNFKRIVRTIIGRG